MPKIAALRESRCQRRAGIGAAAAVLAGRGAMGLKGHPLDA
ncbi:MAG TPA: hypothetical protein VLM11_07015 [Streptosporangiaceae bacterium]|nr:hypothetical protein [Streptosporangiaceae bacterium]